MKFELFDCELMENVDFYDYETKIIHNFHDFEKSRLFVKDNKIKPETFEQSILINIIFFDGSLPKRTIKNVEIEPLGNDLIIETNRKDLTFSTMDYRLHCFLIKIPKIEFKSIKLT